MRTQIRSRGFSLTEALKTYVEDRVSYVLTRYGDNISTIDVTLCDINGPRGGWDKRCRVTLKLDNREPVVIEHTHYDLYAAISNCGARLRRAVARKIAQRRRRRRSVSHARCVEVLQ